VVLQSEWSRPERRGLLSADPRVRTLRKVLVTYPAVRYILPDRISLDSTVDTRTLESVSTFLQRQHWLVKTVITESPA
jgi:hypothetical protein